MTPREPRRKVFVKARIRIGGSWGDVCVRDISSRGLLLHSRSAPPRGTYIEVCRGSHRIVARVIWSKDQHFGVQAQDRISVDGFVGEPDSSGVDFASARKADPQFERRSSPRTAAALEQKAERSRRIAATLQFAAVVGLGGFAATMAFDAVAQTLSAPLTTVTATLEAAGGSPR